MRDQNSSASPDANINKLVEHHLLFNDNAIKLTIAEASKDKSSEHKGTDKSDHAESHKVTSNPDAVPESTESNVSHENADDAKDDKTAEDTKGSEAPAAPSHDENSADAVRHAQEVYAEETQEMIEEEEEFFDEVIRGGLPEMLAALEAEDAEGTSEDGEDSPVDDIYRVRIPLFTGYIGPKKLRRAGIYKVAKAINSQLRKIHANSLVSVVEQASFPLFREVLEGARKKGKWIDTTDVPDTAADTLLIYRFGPDCTAKVEGLEMTPSAIKGFCESEGIDCDLFLGRGKRTKIAEMDHEILLFRICDVIWNVLRMGAVILCLLDALHGFWLMPIVGLFLLLYSSGKPFVKLIRGDVSGTALWTIYEFADFHHNLPSEKRAEISSPRDFADIAQMRIYTGREEITSILQIVVVIAAFVLAAALLISGGEVNMPDLANIGASDGASAIQSSIWDN